MPSELIQKQKIALDFGKQISSRLGEVDLSVFLCGASIKDDPNFQPQDAMEKVRYYVLQKLRQEKIQCYLGEDQSLIEAGEKAFRESFSLARHEIALATDHYDLTVIFPCSHGSIAELGMFCLSNAASKMLIIVDDKYRNKRSYLNLGPIKEADLNKATVKYCDYNDLDRVWQIIDSEIINLKFIKIKGDYF